MFKKKSSETANQILELLPYPVTSFNFITIRPIIFKLITSIYVKGRRDQANKVPMIEHPDGSISFPAEKHY